MKKLLFTLMAATVATTAFANANLIANIGWMPNLGASQDQGCLSNSAYSSTDSRCPTNNTFAQNVFNSYIQVINQIITEEGAATTTKGITQPSSVISGWSTMDNKTRAQKLADYGFTFQNTTLKPFLSSLCKTGNICKAVFVAPAKKGIDRVLEKNPTDGAAANLDYSRATIVADYQDIPEILADINQGTMKSGAQKLAVVKNRLMYPTGTLYRDVQVLLKDPKTGFISELLILGPLMAQEKNDTSHKLYEEIRQDEAAIDAIKLDVENNKKTLSQSDQDQISLLQKRIADNKAKTNQLHDYIFRTDSLTSCGEVGSNDYNKCKTELSKYIIKPNF